MMKSLVPIISLLAFILPYAAAHGLVTKLTIDGNVYKGNVPNGAVNPSIIRLISDPSPVKGAMNAFVNCGPSAGPAALIGDANPGSVMEFEWTGVDYSNWPHNTGPMLTYMASCGSTTCDKFDSTTAKWFKIQQVGRKSNGGDWAQVDLMNGAPATVNVPSTLMPGNYLIRHEIIALHLATAMGGAEFYPSCTQLRVGGNQTGGPADNELVSLPGAYNDNDPGIFDPQVFDASATYTFPGPPVASFVSNAGNTNPASPSATSSSTTSTSTSSPSSASSTGTSGTCYLKRKPNTNTAGGNSTTTYRPRHISRIMKRWTFGSLH